MPNRPDFLYWDTSVFTAYFNQEDGRHGVLDEILRYVRASNGHTLIATSTITIVESTWLQEELNRQVLDDHTERMMDLMWEDRSVVRIIPVHYVVSAQTRQIRRALYGMVTLRFADAIHVGTATWLQVREMHSYDQDHLNMNEHFEFPIMKPRLWFDSLL